MEPLWSPVVATGGNRSQNGEAQKPHKQAKTFAVGCDRLPQRAHGKEGDSGSSPEEGFAKAPEIGASRSGRLAEQALSRRSGAVYGAFRSTNLPHRHAGSRSADRTAATRTVGGTDGGGPPSCPITGAGVVPCSWRSTRPGGPMRLKGDTPRLRPRRRARGRGAASANQPELCCDARRVEVAALLGDEPV